MAIIAAYGKMGYGNILNEIQKHYTHNIIAGAYVPTKHSYLPNDDRFTDFSSLQPILKKLDEASSVKIPKSFKNPFSNIFPNLRSRLGVKIYKDDKCDNCGICNTACDNKAIINGKTNKACIRCLKCVTQCPKQALHFSKSLSMRIYLRKKKLNKLLIYV